MPPSNKTDHSVSKQGDSMPRSLVMLLPGATHTHCPPRTCMGQEAAAQAGYVILRSRQTALDLPGLLFPLIKDRATKTARVSGSYTCGMGYHFLWWPVYLWPLLVGSPSVSFWLQCGGHGPLIPNCQVVTRHQRPRGAF